MARLKGPYLFTGSIGNVRSYYNSHLKRYIVSAKGGASKEIIMNSPSFARTRENMNEFKACGKWASQLRKSLMPLDNLHGGSYFTDIIKLAKIIQSKDDIRPKGYRAIELSRTDPLLVTRLNFNKRNSLGSTLFNFPQITFSDDQKSVSLAIHDFNTRHDLHWPSSFWSFRFILAIAQLPDFVYDEEQNEYRPVIPDLELLTVAAFTQWLSAVTAPPEIKLEAAFAAPALQHPGTTVIVALEIEISSVPMAATGTLTPHQGTMGILNCFV